MPSSDKSTPRDDPPRGAERNWLVPRQEGGNHLHYHRALRLLKSLKERSHKHNALREVLELGGPEAFEELVHRIIQDSLSGKEELGDLLIAVAEFSVGLSEKVRSELAEIASTKKHPETTSFFSSPPASVPLPEKVGEPLKGREGRPLTLGERKSLARNPGRHLLEKLLSDPSPEVIRNLLRSPKVTEKDVVRIAATRPISPDILREVFGCKKWLSSYRVRLTLLSNPYLPPEVGLKLIPTLLLQDLRRLMDDSLMHPDLRDAMRRVASRRCRGDEGLVPIETDVIMKEELLEQKVEAEAPPAQEGPGEEGWENR